VSSGSVCRIYWEGVLAGATFVRRVQLSGLDTLWAVNDRVVTLARTLKATRERKLRVDSTVVELISITQPAAS
jgi:IS5 family transposase